MYRGGRGRYAPRGRSSSEPAGSTTQRPVEGGRSSYKAKGGSSLDGSKNRGVSSVGCGSEQSDLVSASDVSCEPFTPSPTEVASSIGNIRLMDGAPASNDRSSGQRQSIACPSNYKVDFGSLSAKSDVWDRHSSGSFKVQTDHVLEGSGKTCESSEPADSGIEQEQASQKKTDGRGKLDSLQSTHHQAPFDICSVRTANVFQLKTPLHLKNKEKRNESKRSIEGQISVLRPGMVHLSHYISLADQVNIIEKCRKLGLGPGGFYQPGYRDGAKLNLKMMCLGKNWDPQMSEYGDERPTDGAKPPTIPDEFCKMVERAIQDSHTYLMKKKPKSSVEDVLPSMTPDICIVNFYTKSGRLGLHQDKDESKETLRRGLPVVSFSIGDSAEFVYGDQRDVDKVEKVVLESGDVLIFGGSSRHIFHGVTTINADTAPKVLLGEANLLPGRLNLTFRQY